MSETKKRQSTFLAWLVRMSLIKRWALMLCFRKENVSEHSHQTAVIAHMLAVIRNRLYGGDLDPNLAATLAIYHEVSESKLQDLNSRTKYMTPEFTKQYKRLEHIAEQECLQTLPTELREDFAPLIIHDNVQPRYQKLIKAADLLSAYIKANDELRFNNREFTHVKDGLEPRLAEFCRELPEVRYFMDTFVECCWATVDQLTGLDQDKTGRLGS
ncbi:MAG: 5'-deoxynucleotidase [Succinivibrio sp.]|nr:5'-deoxynucleotidase [Succinivibrio sp.]